MVVGAKVCELTDGFLWFVCGNFDVSPKLSKCTSFSIQTCKEKLEPVDYSRMIVLSSSNRECYTTSPTQWCKGQRQFVSARARWWYLAAAHCDHPKVLRSEGDPQLIPLRKTHT